MSITRRKICVVTTSRADYGLLYWLMREIAADDALELQIIATGTHMSAEFGLTYKQIESDGFDINEKIEIVLASDGSVSVSKMMGLACLSFGESFDRLKPNIVVVLGDRAEVLACVQVAYISRIPVAHIHGGEVTSGSLDDAIRHAITKLSHIHFPVAEPYKMRILQMGECSDNVFNYGAPGLDHLAKTKLFDPAELESMLDIKLRQFNILVTYLPATMRPELLLHNLSELLAALRKFYGAALFFTAANADEGGLVINQKLREYVSLDPEKRYFFPALGTQKYLSLAKCMNVVVGNSSSGIIELPYLKIPIINLGDRQAGRLQANTIINSSEDDEMIWKAINFSQSAEFEEKKKNFISPYGSTGASLKIKEKLKNIDLDEILYKFFDGYKISAAPILI